MEGFFEDIRVSFGFERLNLRVALMPCRGERQSPELAGCLLNCVAMMAGLSSCAFRVETKPKGE
jgi:hypothetical protein